MKTLKHCIASLLFVIVMTVALAAEMRTVAVISVADIDTAVKTLKAVTTQAGYPDAMAQVEMQLSMLQGFDLKQPIGIVLLADEGDFAGYAFVPVSDISATPLGMLLAMGERQADGSIMLPEGVIPVPAYVKQSGKWAFISVLKELPKTLPTDPVRLLESMDKEYLVGVKANVANLPKDMVMGALSMFRMMAQMQAQSEADLEALDASFDQIEMLLNELKTFSFGLAVTPQNDIVFDVTAEAVAGSVLAADMASVAAAKTGQIGFFQPQDSIAAFVAAGVLNALVKQQYNAQLTSFFEGARESIEEGDLGADEIAAAKSVLDNVEAMLKSTIDTGKIDVGLTWLKNGTLLAGAAITDGNKLQLALEKSLVAVPDEFRQFVKFNTEQFEGYAVSTIAVPLSQIPAPTDDMPKELASKTVSLQIAIKDTAIALALGLEDSVLTDLKKAITASKESVSLPQTNFVLTPGNLVDFVKLFAPSDPVQLEQFDMGMEMLRAFPPDAQITGSETYSGNTQKSKIVVSGKLLPGIGKFIGMGIEGYRQGMEFGRQRAFENMNDDFDFDF
ncbi:MAG: hypothetical protein FWD31_04315 [Planctomycetaceae bacterium]|nr:hypothetical protein [Planctomycetaceae bacterium]